MLEQPGSTWGRIQSDYTAARPLVNGTHVLSPTPPPCARQLLATHLL